MMPKEKAKQLFDLMFERIFEVDFGVNTMKDKERYDAAKKCATITVIEILLALPDKTTFEHGKIGYWNEVKEEINDL